MVKKPGLRLRDRISVEISRPHGRASVEACRGVLDINELNCRCHLPKPPKDEVWIQVQARDADGNWQSVTQYIRVERRARHSGGAQAYFRCWCDQRAAP